MYVRCTLRTTYAVSGLDGFAGMVVSLCSVSCFMTRQGGFWLEVLVFWAGLPAFMLLTGLGCYPQPPGSYLRSPVTPSSRSLADLLLARRLRRTALSLPLVPDV